MATFLGQLGNGQAGTAGTTIVVTNGSGQNIPAGTLIHIAGCWDNIASVTAPTITCSAVGGGTAIANHATAVGQGQTTTAGSGVWHQCFRVLTTTLIPPGNTIATLTSNQSAVKRAAAAEGFTDATTTLRSGPVTNGGASGSSNTSNLTPVTGDVLVGSTGFESNAAPSNNMSAPFSVWGGVATTGGGSAANIGAFVNGGIAPDATARFVSVLAGADVITCFYILAPSATGANVLATPADTAAGEDEATALFQGPFPLVFPETFTNGLPRDIDVVTYPPDPNYGVYPVTLDNVVGNPAPSLWTNGSFRGWRGKPYSRWDITGNFTYTFDMLQGGGRDIYEALFWSQPNGADPVNGVDGFSFRFESSGDSSGFSKITNNNLSSIGSRYANLPLDTWYRVTIEAVGTVVTGTVRRVSDSVVVGTPVTVDLAPHLDAEHFTRGVFGQQWSVSGTAQGTNIDNINVVGTQRVTTYEQAVVASGAVVNWKMDEPSGNQFLDSIGTRHATLQATGDGGGPYTRGTTPIAPGLGASTRSDNPGNQGGIQASFTNPETIPAPVTFECWIAPTEGGFGGMGFQSLWLGAMQISLGLAEAQLWTYIKIYLGDGNNNWLVSNVDVTLNTGVHGATNEFMHLVVTVSPTTWVAYQNGVQFGTGPTNGQVNLTGLVGNGWTILSSGTGNKGRHSNHAYYNQVLSPQQVAAHYLLGITAPPAPPVDLTSSPADTATGSDSVTAVYSRPKTPGDTAGAVDAVTNPQGLVRTPGDTAAGADALTDTQDLVRTPADTAAGTDTAIPVQTIDRTAADTAGGVDDAQVDRAAAANVLATPADTAAGADTATPVQTIDRTGADTAGGVDSATELQAYERAGTDTAAGSDSHTSIQTFLRTPADTAASVDSATELQTYDRIATDTAAGSDTADAQLTVGGIDLFKVPADTAAGSDTHTVLSDDVRAAADTAAGTDALTVSWDRTRVPADLAGGTDTASAGIALDRSGVDVAGGLDSASSTYDRPSIPADTAGGMDSVTSSQLYARLTQADDLATGSDLITSEWIRAKQAADLAGGTDSSSVLAGRAPAPSDLSGGSDTTSLISDRVSPATDNAVGSDSVNVSRTGFTGATADDIATGLDSASLSGSRDRSVADTAAGSDSPSTSRATPPTSDLASGSDTITTVYVRLADLVDLANGVDAVTAARAGVITWTVDDPASGSDSVGTSAGRGRVPADTAGGSDSATTTLSRAAISSDLADGTDTATLVAVRTRTASDAAVGADSITATLTTSRIVSVTDVAAGTDLASTVLYLAALTQSGVGSYPV